MPPPAPAPPSRLLKQGAGTWSTSQKAQGPPACSGKGLVVVLVATQEDVVEVVALGGGAVTEAARRVTAVFMAETFRIGSGVGLMPRPADTMNDKSPYDRCQ